MNVYFLKPNPADFLNLNLKVKNAKYSQFSTYWVITQRLLHPVMGKFTQLGLRVVVKCVQRFNKLECFKKYIWKIDENCKFWPHDSCRLNYPESLCLDMCHWAISKALRVNSPIPRSYNEWVMDKYIEKWPILVNFNPQNQILKIGRIWFLKIHLSRNKMACNLQSLIFEPADAFSVTYVKALYCEMK